MKRIFVFVSAVLALASCGKPKNDAFVLDSDQSLAGASGSWQLVFLEKENVAQTLVLADMTLSAGDGGSAQISGSMGENMYFASVYSESDGALKVDSFGNSMRASTPEVMEFESLFAEFMTGIDAYALGTVKGEALQSLELKNSALKTRARFVRNSIFDTVWRLDAINEGNAVVGVDSEATLKIEGSAAILYTGINNGSLAVSVSEADGAVSFSDGPLTKAAGDEESMRIESLLLQNLFRARRFGVAGSRLSFYEDDILLLEFTKQDMVSLLQ